MAVAYLSAQRSKDPNKQVVLPLASKLGLFPATSDQDLAYCARKVLISSDMAAGCWLLKSRVQPVVRLPLDTRAELQIPGC